MAASDPETARTDVASRRRRPVDPAPTSGWVGIVYESGMVVLAVTVVATLTQPDRGLIRVVNLAIWGVFVADYLLRLAFSGDRMRFVRSNVIDLVAILPADFFRAARALRIVRLLRLLRAAAVLVRVSSTVRSVLGTNALGWVLVACGLVILLGAGTVMVAEPGLGGFGDAIWWSIVTATTVGYGDIAPVSVAGRAVAVVLMIVGIGTLGMITGSIATYFVGRADGPTNPHVQHICGQLEDWDELSTHEQLQVIGLLNALVRQEQAHDLPSGRSESPR